MAFSYGPAKFHNEAVDIVLDLFKDVANGRVQNLQVLVQLDTDRLVKTVAKGIEKGVAMGEERAKKREEEEQAKEPEASRFGMLDLQNGE